MLIARSRHLRAERAAGPARDRVEDQQGLAAIAVGGLTGTVASAKPGFEKVATKSSRRGSEIAQGVAAQPGPVDSDIATPAGLDWKLTVSIEAQASK